MRATRVLARHTTSEAMAPSHAPAGCVTGRLQPVHNGHLELFRMVLAAGLRLIVGITNPDPPSREAHPDHDSRHLAENNPFTFHQRLTMVHAALASAGISPVRYDIVPFPLHNPERVEHYVPLDVVQYVRVFSSPWEAGKADMLRGYGYTVELVDGDGEHRITASSIREAYRLGRPWRDLVPAPVADLVDDYIRSGHFASRP